MSNKKGMELPQGVVIVALILIVLVIIILVFVVGGFGTVGQKLKDLFEGQTKGQSIDLTIQTCNNLCDSSKNLDLAHQQDSGYCKKTFIVDDDTDPKTPPKKMGCGRTPSEVLTDEEKSKGIEAGSLNVVCDVKC